MMVIMLSQHGSCCFLGVLKFDFCLFKDSKGVRQNRYGIGNNCLQITSTQHRIDEICQPLGILGLSLPLFLFLGLLNT